MAMTTKQKAFVSHYVKNGFNASAAGISAGYSKKGVGQATHKLLKNTEIQNAIKKQIKKTLGAVEELTVKWVNKVVEIAFSEPNIVIDKLGNRSISHTDQMKALDLLGKYLTLYSEKRIIEKENSRSAMTRRERQKRILELSKTN